MVSEKTKTTYANIIATVTLAVFLLFWTMIDKRLTTLETTQRKIDCAVSYLHGLIAPQPSQGHTSSPKGTLQP